MNQEEFIKVDANRRGVPIIREESHNKLIEIVSRLQPKTILEIGTAVGYSGMLMLSTCKDAKLITIEHDIKKVEEARQNFKDTSLDDRVVVVHADCMEELSTMVAEGNYDNYFDFIFLDGPKAQYIKMLEALILLTKKGGTILADNVLFRGFVKDKTLMPRRFKTIVKRLNMFLDEIAVHKDIKEYKLYEIEDGMVEITLK